MHNLTITVISLLLSIQCHSQTTLNQSADSLLQAVWELGVVNPEQAEIDAGLGNDPRSLIELPTVTSWSVSLTGPDMSEVNLIVPAWAVLDSSGIRNGALFSVWCDNGNLYQDILSVYDLEAAEGNATVEWAFDGEPFVSSSWQQQGKLILPSDGFPHDAFVRRLATANFLVLKIQGHAGISDSLENVYYRPQNAVVVPVSLTGDRSSLLSLIQDC